MCYLSSPEATGIRTGLPGQDDITAGIEASTGKRYVHVVSSWEDRTSTLLGRGPHIVPPGKRARVGIRNPRPGERTPDSLPIISSHRVAYIVPSGKFRPRHIVRPRKIYRSPWETLSSYRGTNHVPPRKSYRPLWEDISSGRGKLIVLPGKIFNVFACKFAFFCRPMNCTLCICFC